MKFDKNRDQFPGKNEAGFTSIKTIIILFFVSMASFTWQNNRTQNNLRSVLQLELEVDEIHLQAAIANKANCNGVDFSSCTVGDFLELEDKEGATLLADTGNSKIGKWNARVQCENVDGATEWWVSLARLTADSSFKKNPETDQPDSWEKAGTLKDFCNANVEVRLLVASEPCYGGQEGDSLLPEPQAIACGSCGFKDKYKFCSNDQREFPSCPAGFQNEIEYIDRYGWGGIDFTKNVICIQTN